MKSYKVIIVEDEEGPVDLIKKYLGLLNHTFDIVQVADTVPGAVEAITQHEPDIVFMDISIRGGTGFNVLNQLEKRDFEVIFVTAYDEYAVKAIRYGALDYIVKPIDEDELMEAVNRACERIDEKKSVQSNMELILSHIQSNQAFSSKFAIPVSDGFRFVNCGELLRIESDSGYSTLYLSSDEKLLVSKTMKYFEEILDPTVFLRVHRSHMINVEQVKQVRTGEGNSILLNDGTDIPISRRNKDKVDQLFKMIMK